jgi:xylulokinase
MELHVGKILVVDMGTTLLKFTLFDRDGRMCQACRVPSPAVADEAGRMEMSTDAFDAAVAQGIGELRDCDERHLADVAALSFATQTNSFVLSDAAGRPLTPLILWPDRRAAEIESEVCRRCAMPGFSATTGLPLVSLQFMVARLLWLQHQSPDVWSRTAGLSLISDSFTRLLTGKHVTEAGAAGLTGLVDIHRCRWWPEMLARFAVEQRWLPEIARAGTDLGPITKEASQRFGLPETCRFVVGCLDQYAGAIGAGNIAPGMLSETTGTALASVRCADRFVAEPRPGVFQGPAFREGLYWQMTFGDVSAAYLQWYRDRLPDRPQFEQLTTLAESIAPGADGLRLKTDRALAEAATIFEGATAQHTRGNEVRCILEGVAVALREQIGTLSRDAMPREVRCAGGGARSDLWLQIKADILGTPTVATTCPEPTSLGAAMLAEAALSGTDLGQIAQKWVSLRLPHHPDSERHRQYEAIYSRMSR